MSVNRVIEVTFTLILAYLVLSNARGFSNVIRSVGSVYTGSVRALQGR